jgi:hypothetical protein
MVEEGQGNLLLILDESTNVGNMIVIFRKILHLLKLHIQSAPTHPDPHTQTHIPRHRPTQRYPINTSRIIRRARIPNPKHRRRNDLVLRLPSALVDFKGMYRVPGAVVACLGWLGC